MGAEDIAGGIIRPDGCGRGFFRETRAITIAAGFEGRYSGGLRGELYSIAERVRSRIENIRGRVERLSPDGLLPAGEVPQIAAPISRVGGYRLVAFAAVILTILCFLALKLHVGWVSDQAYRKLL